MDTTTGTGEPLDQYKTIVVGKAAVQVKAGGLGEKLVDILKDEQFVMNACMDAAFEVVEAHMESPAGIDMFAGAPDMSEAGGPGQLPNIMGPAAALAKMQVAGPMAVALYERVRRELDEELERRRRTETTTAHQDASS